MEHGWAKTDTQDWTKKTLIGAYVPPAKSILYFILSSRVTSAFLFASRTLNLRYVFYRLHLLYGFDQNEGCGVLE